MTGDQGAPYAFYNAPIPRLGIPALKMADAGGGVAPARLDAARAPDSTATALPAEIALGATWSPDVGPAVRARSSPTRSARPARTCCSGRTRTSPGSPGSAGSARARARIPLLNARPQHGVRRGHPVAQRHRHAEALHRLQPGDQPQHRAELDHRPADPPRGLRARLRVGHRSGRAGCGHVLLQQDQRRVLLPERHGPTAPLLKGRLGFTGFVMTDFGALHDTLTGLAPAPTWRPAPRRSTTARCWPPCSPDRRRWPRSTRRCCGSSRRCSGSASSTPTTHRPSIPVDAHDACARPSRTRPSRC